jgi:hypothetical protein
MLGVPLQGVVPKAALVEQLVVLAPTQSTVAEAVVGVHAAKLLLGMVGVLYSVPQAVVGAVGQVPLESREMVVHGVVTPQVAIQMVPLAHHAYLVEVMVVQERTLERVKLAELLVVAVVVVDLNEVMVGLAAEAK